MKKRRNRKMVGMIAVLMIIIVLFTTIAEAKREKIVPGAVPSAEAAAASPATQAATGKPANERYEVTVVTGTETKTYVYDSLDEIKRDTSLNVEQAARDTFATNAKPIFETPIGDVTASDPFPSNPGFKMDPATGKFTSDSEILEPAQDGLGNYEIKRGENVVKRGIKVQMRDKNGQPNPKPDAFAIQETDNIQHTVQFRVGNKITNPMSIDLYKKLLGDTGEMIKDITADGSTIQTVSGATYKVKEEPLVVTGTGTIAGETRTGGPAGTSITTIPKIIVNTVEETRGDKKTTHKEYNFKTSGIRGEEVDGKIVLNMQDGTKIYPEKPGEFEAGIASGTIPAKVQGKSYEYTMTHDAETGNVVLKRDGAKDGRARAEKAVDEAEIASKTANTKLDEDRRAQKISAKAKETEYKDAVANAEKLLTPGTLKDKSLFSLNDYDLSGLTEDKKKKFLEAREVAVSKQQALKDAKDAAEEAVAEAKRVADAAKQKLDSRTTARDTATYDSEEIIPNKDGTTTIRYTTNQDDKIVDFESSITTDKSGRVTAKVERTSTGVLDVGKIDFGIFKLGGYDGKTLKKTVYGADGKTYTQVSNKFDVDEKTGYIDHQPSGVTVTGSGFASTYFESDGPLINYDPDTGEIRSYPAKDFNPNDPVGGEVKATVGTKLGFGGLFGTIPDELEDESLKSSGLSEAEKEAIRAEYIEGAAKERAARFASAQDYAATFGQLSSLFADNGAFKAWSRRTDILFNNWIMGGSEYRVSKICESNLRKIPANVLVVQTPGGQLVTAAFVNGERQAFKNPINNSVEYLYKISYKVNIPESLIDKAEVHIRQRIRAIDDPVPAAPARILRKDPGTGQRLEEFLAEGPFFNIILFGKSGRKCIFIDSGSKKCEGESVKKGANAVQRNMFVKYSPNDYTRVCIEFTRSLEFANKKANSICADIVGVNDQPRNVVDVPEAPTENPSIGEDGTSSGATAGPIPTTATGQIITADI